MHGPKDVWAQSIEMYNKLGQRLRSDGKVATEKDPVSEPRRVVQYIAMERKWWMPDGWILRAEREEVAW